jgi:hypothetical protein
MTDFILIPAVTGICIYGFYKIIELLVRRKERIMMVDRLSDIKSPEGMIIPNLQDSMGGGRYMSLRAGSLLAGLGLGLLIGYIIAYCTLPENFGAVRDNVYYNYRDMMGIAYGASTLLFGGIGLLCAFVIEMKLKKK